MNNDLTKTQHYTRNKDYICQNLTKYFSEKNIFIEPFVGEGDLLSLYPNSKWEMYDIEPKVYGLKRDTLENPPSYKDRIIITNPPFLARNKALDKSIYNKTGLDDLYKIFLSSIMECEGGIVIIPFNFFTDTQSAKVRKRFLDNFTILEINVFLEPVFPSTTYSVCSFAFAKRHIEKGEQELSINIFPAKKSLQIKLYPEYNYRLGGEALDKIKDTSPLFGRLIGETSADYITHMKLETIDRRQSPFGLTFQREPIKGKVSDRTTATLTCARELSEEEERKLIQTFNEEMTELRERYYNLIFTNYRDYGRKRVEFDFVYRYLTKIINEDA